VVITSQQWKKESNVLFDYETLDSKKSSLTVLSKGFITRKENNLSFQTEESLQPNILESYIATLRFRNGTSFFK